LLSDILLSDVFLPGVFPGDGFARDALRFISQP